MTALAILAGTFIVLLLFGVPIFFSLIAACIALLTSNGLMSPQLVMQRVYACLLYTSPSPRDVEESRMPSSA